MSYGEFINATAIPGAFLADNAMANEYRFVALSATGCDIATSGMADGIIAETYAAGDQVAVYADGYGLLYVNGNSANIDPGDFLKPTTAGAGVKADTNKDAYGAQALEAATSDGVVIRVKIVQGYLGV